MSLFDTRRRRTSSQRFDGVAPEVLNTDRAIRSDVSPAMTTEIADGAGGDASQGLGAFNLSDTYIVPSSPSNYAITAPNVNTVHVEYWTASDGWVPYNTHSFTGGTATVPGFVEEGLRAGSGPALAGGDDSIWRWRGTDVFYLLINDLDDDEETVFGYMNDWRNNIPNYKFGNTIRNQADNEPCRYNNNNIIQRSAPFDFRFQLDEDVVGVYNTPTLDALSNDFAIETWVNFDTFASTPENNGFQTIFSKGVSPGNFRLFYASASNNLEFRLQESTVTTDVNFDNNGVFTTGEWVHVVCVKSSVTGQTIYVNNTQGTSNTSFTGDVDTNTSSFFIGDWNTATLPQRTFLGRLGYFRVYDRVLTEDEIARNYAIGQTRFS